MKHWHVVMCKPKQEEWARENLERQGYVTFLPKCIQPKRRRGQWRDVVEPLFPRYLFIQLSSGDDNWYPIRSTRGVSELVRFGQEYAQVPDDVIASIHQREGQDGLVRLLETQVFKKGDRVRLVQGALQGVEAIFAETSSDNRVFILLELLGQQKQIQVNLDWLVPASI